MVWKAERVGDIGRAILRVGNPGRTGWVALDCFTFGGWGSRYHTNWALVGKVMGVWWFVNRSDT